MAPLIVKESCLNCHAAQAYKLGDVRGGISVTMPAASTLAAIEKETLRMLVQHGAAYVVISGLMVLLYLRAQAHIRTLDETARIQEDLVKTRTQELLEANAALGRSNAELEQFAYAVSHDLQEPLRMVASYVQLLGRRYQSKLDEDADAFIGYASDGAKRMQQMITDLLEFSRVQTKNDPFLPVAMDKALDLALGNLDLVLKETQCRIEADRASLPLVYGDKGQLSRLFQNLIGNAVKYRDPARAPHISIKAERQDGFWTFSVQDNGIGIEPQHFERIFRVFQRLHGRGTYEGNGIGLAICKKIVERHGGRIWVESKPGQGTCFYFTLPGYSGQIAKAGE
ncbi:MAG: GHKL domain-containing protein [Alphaproteobacteria bacterium]|nr:GHKL domain-containing protein [Alphaproteobacteria bacterium]